MPSKLKLRSRLFAALLLAAALLQGTVPLTNERVRRLGDQLKCKCGCQASITGCNMINCHFADPVRITLLTLVDQGRGDQEIFDAIVAQHGRDILLKPPTEGFYLMSWAMPFVTLAGGLALIYLLLQRWKRRPATAAGVDVAEAESSDLARYKDRIEKDLSNLE